MEESANQEIIIPQDENEENLEESEYQQENFQNDGNDKSIPEGWKENDDKTFLRAGKKTMLSKEMTSDST